MAKKSDSEAMDTALEQSVPFQVSGPKGDLPGPVELACEAFGIGWRHLLAWRVRESQPARDSCERPTPFTGTFIEEVSTPGAGRPPWGL